MAKLALTLRNQKRLKTIEKFKTKRAQLFEILQDVRASDEAKAEARTKLQKLPRDASPVRLRNRCALTGRPRGVYRKFGLARNKLRDLALKGEVPAVAQTRVYEQKLDAKGRVTCSPMNLSRMGVYLWKQAVEKAGSLEVDKVRTALVGQKFKGPAGEVTMQANHHLVNNVYIGETLASGQFKVIKSFTGVAGEPFSEKFLPK